MSVLALVPAAGDGVRLGVGVPEALVRVGGIPLVVRAVRSLLGSGVVDHVLVAVREADLAGMRKLFAEFPAVDLVVGGADRTSSVAAALHCGVRRYPDARTVLVHDAARALTPPVLVNSLVKAVAGGVRAVIPVLPVADTIKQASDAGSVRGTVDRSALRTAQTPQAFDRALLERAYADVSVGMDDAGLVERLGEPVHTVPGDPLAFKITTPWDLRIAELLVGS